MPEWMLVLATYAFVNLLAPGATLTQGNRLQLALGGALIGLLGNPLARALGNPQGSPSLLPDILVNLLMLALLLIPALATLDGPQRPRLSVADGFLFGFLPAFGYDAASALLAPERMVMLPPDARGYAWICGLITLGWTAGYRLSLHEGHAQFWAFCALAWGVFDRLNPIPAYGKFAVHYGVLPWTALLLLFWMAWLERVWVQRSPGHRQLDSLSQLRVPGLMDALKHGPAGWLARERGLALRTQLILERTEMLERGRTVMGEIPTAYRLDPVYPDYLGWGLRALALALGALLVIYVESLSILVLGSVLVVIHYLRSTDLDLDEANSVVSSLGHQIALHGALSAALASLFFSKLIPHAGLILGLGLVALALQDPLRRDWQLFLEPYQRRLSMFHRTLAIFLTVVLALAGAALYGPWSRLVSGLVATVTTNEAMRHYTGALTWGCALALAALVASKLAAIAEETFDVAARRSANH